MQKSENNTEISPNCNVQKNNGDTYKNSPRKLAKIKSFKDEFANFLWEYSVMGLAIGVIIGGAVNTFVQSLVNGIFSPLLQLILPYNTLKDIAYTYNGVTFSFGPLINAFLNLLLVALLIFLFMKYLFFKGGKIDKSKISKT